MPRSSMLDARGSQAYLILLELGFGAEVEARLVGLNDQGAGGDRLQFDVGHGIPSGGSPRREGRAGRPTSTARCSRSSIGSWMFSCFHSVRSDTVPSPKRATAWLSGQAKPGRHGCSSTKRVNSAANMSVIVPNGVG